MPLQKSQATFLILPLELRLQIYEYIFLCKEQINPYKNRKHRAERSLPPSILRTCKQIHQEASPILYSQNIFSISFPPQIFKWLTEIGRANIKLLNTVHICVIGHGSTDKFSAKETAFWYKVLDLLPEKLPDYGILKSIGACRSERWIMGRMCVSSASWRRSKGCRAWLWVGSTGCIGRGI